MTGHAQVPYTSGTRGPDATLQPRRWPWRALPSRLPHSPPLVMLGVSPHPRAAPPSAQQRLQPTRTACLGPREETHPLSPGQARRHKMAGGGRPSRPGGGGRGGRRRHRHRQQRGTAMGRKKKGPSGREGRLVVTFDEERRR